MIIFFTNTNNDKSGVVTKRKIKKKKTYKRLQY